MLFSKYLVEPFLRAWNDAEGWILELWPWNVLADSEKIAPNLENVKQAFVWQTVQFDFAIFTLELQ